MSDDPAVRRVAHRDSDERTSIEEELRETRQTLDLAERAAGAGIWDWDIPSGRLVWSRHLFELFGLDPDTATATFDTWLQVVHPDDRQPASQRIEQAVKDGSRLASEYRVVLPSGAARRISALGSTIYDRDGRPLRMSGICLDVTARWQTERNQRLSTEIMRLLNDPVPEPNVLELVLAAIKRIADLDAVGLRLRSGDDFPYLAQSGFSDSFLQTENTLLACCGKGDVLRDESGKARLECTCGLALSGKIDPGNPLRSPGGSLVINDSPSLLDLPAAEDPRFQPRNRCIHEGYRSVALIPVRVKGENVGLLQLNDREAGRFSPETISFFEGVCAAIGLALQRRNAEEALRQSEAGLREALDIARLGRWELDLTTNHLEWSDGVFALFEVSRESFPASYEAFLAFIHPDDRDAVDQAYRASVANKEPYEIEHRLLLPDGRVKWVSEIGRIMYDAAGSPVRSIGTVQDITERKQLAGTQAFLLKYDYLHGSATFFEALAEHLATALGMEYVCIDRLEGDGLTARTVAVYHDGTFEKNVSYAIKDTPCGAVVGKTVCIFPKEVSRLFPDDAGLQQLRAESYVGATLWSFDGKPIGLIVLIGRKPLANAGLVESMLSLVTSRAAGELERLRAEKAIQEAHAELESRVQERTAELAAAMSAMRKDEERFRTVADFTWDWEYWICPERTVFYMSPSCERITGHAAAEFLERSELLGEIVHPEDRAAYAAHMEETDDSDDPGQIDYRIVTGSGAVRWIDHRCQVVYGADGTHLGRRVSSRDITEQRLAEAEKELLEAQMRQNEKLAVIGQLAGGMAHDFNNLLAVIMSSAEMVQLKPELSPDQTRHCTSIQDAVDRGAELIRQLMSFARKGQYAQANVNLGDLVQEVHTFLLRTVDRLIHLEARCPQSSVVVQGDPAQLQAALMNLAVNARDAMPRGGDLLLSAERVELDPAFCRMRPGLLPGAYACLQVRDTGIGMGPETRERIFEPFFTTKPKGKGTGLGLASVFGTVKSHNGYIEVDSAPGEGTTFRIYLPLAPDSAPVSTVFAGDEIVRGQGRILLAEDEPLIRQNVSQALCSLGYEVEVVQDGRQAIECFREHPALIDLVLLDMIMPVMNGWDTFREIRRIRPDARVLFVSGYSDAELVHKAHAEGVCGFVEKPVKQARLSQAVAAALRCVCGRK